MPTATDPASPGTGVPRRPAGAGGGVAFTIGLTVFEVVASIAVFRFVSAHGGGPVAAYVWASVAPLAGMGIYFVKTHDFSGASIAIMAFNLLSAGVAIIGNTSPKMLLYKDCFATAIIGIVFAATLVVGKPLAYHYGQRFWGGSSPEGIAWWRGLWRYAEFRATLRLVTALWAVLLLVDSAVTAVAIRLSTYHQGYVWDQLLWVVLGGLGLLLTIWISRRAWAKADEP